MLVNSHLYGNPFSNLSSVDSNRDILTDEDISLLNSIKRKRIRYISCFHNFNTLINGLSIFYIIFNLIMTILIWYIYMLYTRKLVIAGYDIVHYGLLCYNLLFLIRFILSYINSICVLHAWDIVDYLKNSNITNIGRHKIIKYLNVKYPRLVTFDLDNINSILNIANTCYIILYMIFMILCSPTNLENDLAPQQRLVYSIYFYHLCIFIVFEIIYFFYILKLSLDEHTLIENNQYDMESQLTEQEVNNILVKMLAINQQIADSKEVDLSVDSKKIYYNYDDHGNKICNICIETPSDNNIIQILKCNHTVCDKCLRSHIKTKITQIACPYCKEVLY